MVINGVREGFKRVDVITRVVDQLSERHKVDKIALCELLDLAFKALSRFGVAKIPLFQKVDEDHELILLHEAIVELIVLEEDIHAVSFKLIWFQRTQIFCFRLFLLG